MSQGRTGNKTSGLRMRTRSQSQYRICMSVDPVSQQLGFLLLLFFKVAGSFSIDSFLRRLSLIATVCVQGECDMANKFLFQLCGR